VPSEKWLAIEEQFHALLSLPDGEQETWLAAHGDDGDVITREVVSLVRAHRSARPLLDVRSNPLSIGSRLGPWQVESLIGTGGMSQVFRARRADGKYEKRVAIKILSGAAALLAGERFSQERQILASLEHSNIARLLDAGVTETGQPYLILDYVEGIPLDQWCEAPHATPERKLDVWLKIAGAVAEAHRQLVIHRDLKPANVLVGGGDEPKLLDFGIAKLIASDESTGLTTDGNRYFTPLYASPEQIRGERATTATDIWALGVLLYQMLTGRHPFRKEGQQPWELARAIQDADLREPSGLAADLAAIVRMALHREPVRRYSSVEQFAADVRNYRSGFPVLAAPDSTSYRLGKFVRRRWAPLAVSTAVFVAIVGVASVALWQARKAERERRIAEEVTVLMAEVLGGVELGVANPRLHTRGKDLRVVEVLDAAAQQVTKSLADRPEVQASLEKVLGNSYLVLGLYQESQKLLDPRSVESRALLGSACLELGRWSEALKILGPCLDRLGAASYLGRIRAELAYAVALFRLGRAREAIAFLEPRLAKEEPGSLPAVKSASYSNLGLFYMELGQLDAALANYKRSETLARQASDPPPAGIMWTLVNQASIYRFLDQPEPMLALSMEAQTIFERTMGKDHPSLIHSLASRAWALARLGRPGAEELIRQGVAIQDRRLPEGHFERAVGLHFLGYVLLKNGQLEEAERVVREALEIRRRSFQQPNWRIAETAGLLGEMLAARGRPDQALPLLTESRDTFLTLYGPGNARTQAADRLVSLWR
jgi:serine/threonine-protein kinase